MGLGNIFATTYLSLIFKSNILNFFKSNILIWGSIFFVVALFTLFAKSSSEFENSCVKANKSVIEFQNNFEEITSDPNFISKIKEKNFTTKDLESFQTIAFQFYVYEDNELIFWNQNTVIPEVALESISEDLSLIKQKNGYYLGIKKNQDNYTLLAYKLIKNNFPIVNKYLQNSFADPFQFQDETVIESASYPNGYPIKNKQNQVLFKLINDLQIKQSPNLLNLILGYLSIILFWNLIFQISKIILKKYNTILTFSFIILSTVIFYLCIHWFDFEFENTILYSPELYASHFFGNSLGHLFLNSLLVFIIGATCAYFFYNKQWLFNKFSYALYSIFLIVIFIIYNASVKSLILDSVISFEINNFILTNQYTLIGLLIIALLSFNLLIFLYIWVYGTYKLFDKKPFLSILFIFIIIHVILYFYSFKHAAILSTAPILILSLFYLFFLRNRQHYNRSNYVIVTILLISMSIAGLLSYYNQINEDFRKATIANQLTENRDLITEYRFEQVQEDIKADPFFKKFFISPLVSQKEMLQRLNYLYFSGYLSKYSISAYGFNLEGRTIKSSDSLSLSIYYDQINKLSEETFSEWLFLIPQKGGKNNYLSILPIENNGNISGTLVIELSPKTYHKENLYPELLIEQKTNPIAKYRNKKDYEYAIYKNDYLISQSGEYPFPYSFSFFNFSESFPFVKVKENHRLNFFEVDDETKVVISSPKISALIPFSVFSYIFFLIGFLILIFYLSLSVLSLRRSFIPFKPIQFNFKNKINSAITITAIASFTVIGIVTIGYFTELYRDNNTDKLIKKQQTVLSSVEYIIEEGKILSAEDLPNSISTEVARLAEIHNIDINLFDLNGNLIVSSQPSVFGNGLVSKKINPLALHHILSLNEERYIQSEQIGNLAFQSVYVPLRLGNGDKIALLNLPYFAQEETLRSELSKLMVTLVNVYVLLLIISIFIAILVSRSITRPLAKISNKLSSINLESKNEEIEWKSDDEIGALVKEYNKMIRQIEESALALAQSERESAWREMARQIAHEIKNPLTPMKLGIQHLQRALKEKPDRVPELAEKVSKTLIEQIDNLSEIATAFSSFAKMPTANKENVNLIEILQNVVNLFEQGENTNIVFQPYIPQAWVFADKNQLLSVFNNLVKNAQQATEDKEDKKIEILISLKENKYIVEVKDNGVGISAEMFSKVFVPNFTTKSSGTGLGLAISKQIIENNKGSIWFESEENIGTSFFVSIKQMKQV